LAEKPGVRAKREQRERARRLRAEGLSVRRIAAELGVSVSSVSVWVRDVATPGPPPAAKRSEPRSGDTRRCGRCRELLPLEAFNRSGTGHQHWCRACFRAYFRSRAETHRQQVAQAKLERRARARAFIVSYLSGRACIDCGEDELLVLEFDHVGPHKRDHVSRLVSDGASVAKLRRELAVCEVVCVNCHRRRSASRGRWFRISGVAPKAWTRLERRNHEHLLEVLSGTPCVDCAEADPVVLELDHLGEKTANVSDLAARGSLARLEAELARCDVRCGNCHRLATLSRQDATFRGSADWLGLDGGVRSAPPGPRGVMAAHATFNR
jgi:AcrR family transcriptional regulator